MNPCPWCGMPVAFHDETFTGARCNLRIAVARLAAVFRKAARDAVRAFQRARNERY